MHYQCDLPQNYIILILTRFQMTSLQQQLNFFIYSSVIDPTFITNIKKDFPPKKVQHLSDSRPEMNLSIREQLRLNAERYAQAFKLSRGSSSPEDSFRYADLIVSTYGLILSTSAFLVSLQLIGDEQQVRYWRQQVLSGRVMGAYGQTQLGHGSNVKQLQTTAVYNPSSQTFTINSPTTSSAKFWPGVLGQYCTHSIIQARTFVEGKDIGVQTFVIEVRDSKLHPLPNVELFDIGEKLGFEKVDNGGVVFRNLQIPRNALLMRYIKVTPEGKVEGAENKQAIKYGYGSMLNLRVKLTYNFALRCMIAPAVAMHSLLTAEGTASSPANRKLITELLYTGLGYTLANKHPHNIFNQLLKEIADKNYNKADKLLVSCHIISSTFKALSSRAAVDLAGYLQTYTPLSKFRTSYIPFFFYTYIPSVTYQGDNTVLLQQTSKYLLFKFNLDKKLPTLPKEFRDDDWVTAAQVLEQVLVERLKKLKGRMEGQAEKGVHFQKIWNEEEQNALIEASVLWGYMTLLQSIASILPTITQYQSFYHKICQGFTSYIVNRVPAHLLTAFTVKPAEAWKNFTEEQFQAMVNINGPIQLEHEPMQLHPREEKWYQAKL